MGGPRPAQSRSSCSLWDKGRGEDRYGYKKLLLRNTTSQAMLFPVVVGLGNDGDDILDLGFQAKFGPGREEEDHTLAPDADIFDHDGT